MKPRRQWPTLEHLVEPDPVDALVGRNIHIHRIDKGLTQIDLGKRIGVTFQQGTEIRAGHEPGWWRPDVQNCRAKDWW
jgi:hypothetical protein